ncbi:DivIVA domain-containing protein [Kineococcus glutinatus]|uniref:Cell wall synthesis protein Wag31 n=1 Tax=Kineococcus glutinatus TaxID=1070872 RepID=A0ABP9HKX6_9ACTN
MTTGTGEGPDAARLTPADVDSVRFSRGNLVNGYRASEVDKFLDRVQHELVRLATDKAELRAQVRNLQEQAGLHDAVPENPTAHAVRILSAAQQTADQYVADAEVYSRRLAIEARERYEAVVQEASEQATAIMQKAELEAATAVGTGRHRTVEDLQEQVVYLQAFGKAFRTQLKSYLEALLADLDSEWRRSDPATYPAPPPAPSLNGHNRADLLPPQLGETSRNGRGEARGERDRVIELPR